MTMMVKLWSISISKAFSRDQFYYLGFYLTFGVAIAFRQFLKADSLNSFPEG